MKIFAHTILPALVLVLGLRPVLGNACAILPKEQAEQRSRQIVEEAKAAAATLMAQADLIFIGRLSKLGVEQDTAGRQGLQHYQAFFEAFEDIKGHYPAGQALAFTRNTNRVWVSVACRPEFWQLPKENGAGELYLVYAHEGKLLRTNHIPADAQALSGNEEAAFLRGR